MTKNLSDMCPPDCSGNHAPPQKINSLADDLIEQLLNLNAPLIDILAIFASGITKIILASEPHVSLRIIESIQESLDEVESHILTTAKSKSDYSFSIKDFDKPNVPKTSDNNS